MYRLSDFSDQRLQKIISREIANGFTQVFSIKNNIADLKKVKEFIYWCGLNADDEMIGVISRVIGGLYKELIDEKAEYTFSEYGEYILYYATEYAMEVICRLSLEGELFEVGEKWKSSASASDILYVMKIAMEHCADLAADDPETEEVEDLLNEENENITMFILQCTYFPCMGYDITGRSVFSFIFWDTDFALIDDLGMAGFAEIKNTLGSQLGMEVGNNCPETGSYRVELEK